MRRQAIRVTTVVLAIALLFTFAACQPAAKITGIEITTPPAKTVYTEGEKFSTDGMVVSKVFDDGKKEAVTDYTVDKTQPLTTADNKVTVKWGEFTATVNITVNAKTVAVTGIEIATLPTKTEYTEGERFNPDGMVVKKVYEDGNKEPVTDYTIDKTGALTTDDHVVKITWGKFTAEVEITVNEMPATVTSIEIATPPTKTEYYEGEKFDATGMVVNKVFEDGSKEEVTDYSVDKTEALTTEDTVVKVTWGKFTVEVSIKVIARKAQELQILALPDKTVYTDGETFDATGMEVYVLYDNGAREQVTDYTVDKTVLTIDDTFVTVSWNDLTVKVNVTVKSDKPQREVTDVEIYQGEDLVYTRTMDVSSIIRYKAVYSDGTKDAEWTFAQAEDLDSYRMTGDNLEVTVSLFVKNKEFQKTVTIPVADNTLSVAELMTQNPDGETVYQVTGIVVSVASTMGRVEYIIYDDVSGKFIGIAGIPATGNMFSGTYVPRYEIGTRICLPVTLIQTAEKAGNSDSKKIYADYAGGGIYDTAIVEAKAEYTISKSDAVNITNQDGLKEFLGAENRSNNFYTIVKLSGPISTIRYGSSPVHYRFYFGNLSFAGHKVDGVSPVFMNSNMQYTVGKTVGELFVGDETWNPTSWDYPGIVNKDIYALFIGGNAYYHEFVILEESDVTDMPRTVESVELTMPDKTSYVVGEKLDLTGGYLTVNFNYGPSKEVVLSEDMLNAETVPDMTNPGKFTIEGTYQGKGFGFEINISAEAAQSIVLTPQLSSTVFNFSNGEESVVEELLKLQLEVTYPTIPTETIAITPNMISFASPWAIGKNTVTVTYLGATVSVEITVVNEALSVSEIKTKEAGETVYDLQGIVVSSAFISGTQSAPENGEVLLRDKLTNDVIGVKNLGVSYKDPLAGLKAGDEIIVRVKIVVTTTTATASECGKLAATLVEGEEPIVLSSGNDSMVSLDSAVVLDSQDDLVAFLENAEVRKGNAYKLVKLVAGTSFVNYNNGLYITFAPDGTKPVKVDGKTPYLHSMNQSMTLGEKTYGDLLFGEGQSLPAGGPFTIEQDLYLMYIGGQGAYYHHFILIGADYVVTPSAS